MPITENGAAQIDEMADLVMQAHEKRIPYPNLTEQYPGFDLRTAYQVQKAYVERRLVDDQIGGFKAGLTSKAAQQHYGFPEPVAGVLYTSGRLEGSPSVDHSQFGFLLIDQEIGFEMGEGVTEPLEDVAALKARVRLLRPMFEVADAGSAEDFEHVRMLDLVAENSGSAEYIAGAPKQPDKVDLSKILLTTTRGSEEINRWEAQNPDDDQWEAALWLANATISNGWQIEPGHILMSGALGTFLGEPGRYHGEFGGLGIIDFEIT